MSEDGSHNNLSNNNFNNYYYNYEPSASSRRAAEEQVKAGIQAKLTYLEEEKRRLQEEVNEASEKLEKQLQHDSIRALLSGYMLSDFCLMRRNDNEQIYSSCCKDSRHPFKLSVHVKESSVTDVRLSIPKDSPLLEVETVLHTLSEELGPYRVLSAIGQFSHMTNFRNEVTRQLSNRNFTYAATPRFMQEVPHNSNVCTVWARKVGSKEPILVLQWTFVWGKTYQSLVHNFFIKKASENVGVRRFAEHLHKTYYSGNEDKLKTAWDDFAKWIRTA